MPCVAALCFALVIKENTLEKQLKEEEKILESISERKGKFGFRMVCFGYLRCQLDSCFRYLNYVIIFYFHILSAHQPICCCADEIKK